MMDARALAVAMAEFLGVPEVDIASLTRLSGGANMESWSFDVADIGYVMRRLPPAYSADNARLEIEDEARLIETVARGNVPVPRVLGTLRDRHGLGRGFVMARIAGTADPHAVQSMASDLLIDDLADALAAIHAVPPPTFLPAGSSTESMIAGLRNRFLRHGGDRPVLAAALYWLARHIPAQVEPRLVHGDFRMGNLMVDDGRLAAVLDWELSHIGDPAADIGWCSINAWRFRRIDRPAFGLTTLDRFIASYERASGRHVERARVLFWQVFGTTNWALMCLDMAAMWRTGTDRSLERLAVGRRCSEAELDLLLLLADGVAAVPPDPIGHPPATGIPSDAELAEAVAAWVRSAAEPDASDRQRFETKVALNLLDTIARGNGTVRRDTDAALATALLAGDKTLDTPGVLAGLRSAALAAVAIDRPRYPAYGHAVDQWRAPR